MRLELNIAYDNTEQGKRKTAEFLICHLLLIHCLFSKVLMLASQVIFTDRLEYSLIKDYRIFGRCFLTPGYFMFIKAVFNRKTFYHIKFLSYALSE